MWVARKLARKSQDLTMLASQLMGLDFDQRLEVLLGRLAATAGQFTR